MLKIKRFLKYEKCIKCKKEFLTVDVRKINDKECICYDCSSERGYSTRNSTRIGKPTQMSFSFEFETDSRNNELYELKKYGFINCYDGSISGSEWKSGIYNNKKSFHAVCRKLDKFRTYVGRSCGTHLHVGTMYKEKIRKYQFDIFGPILEEMRNNEKTTKKFWGRYFNHYCMGRIEVHERYNAFNTLSSVETLEFRLLKFINSKQYIRAADFCIDTTRYINHHIKKENFNEEYAKKIGKTILKKYKEVTQSV